MGDVKKILFIAWDSPQVTYLEGLFTPIFQRLTSLYGYEFHVVQFSWADAERVKQLEKHCREKGIRYTHCPVIVKPVAMVGKYLTLFKGIRFLRTYIKQEGIDIVMPRSTMPAKMVTSLGPIRAAVKVVFDADGLPIEERVDFAGLKHNSFRYNQLKKIERRIIINSDIVLTRTAFAARYLSDQYKVSPSKFFVVKNGRDERVFRFEKENRLKSRLELNIPQKAVLLVYCGSMGPQYGVRQMLDIFRRYKQENPQCYFLVLTNHPEYLQRNMAEDDKVNLIVKSTQFEKIPFYLSAGDLAFAIRKATFSMKGVAPIKLGEYFLMGLPVIASAGIGDSDTLLKDERFVFLLPDYSNKDLEAAVQWMNGLHLPDHKVTEEARVFGEANFSLSESVKSYHTALSVL